MQNDPLSHGLWEATAPPAPPTPPLEGEARADVAVVGCGYTGLSAALHLAEAGARVVALEAVEVGFGAAGRNVGLVNAGMWVLPSAILKALGPDYGERPLTLLDGGPAAVWALIERLGIACEAVPRGTLKCAVGRAGLEEIQRRADEQGRRGAPVRVLSAAETAGAARTAALTSGRSSTRARARSSRWPTRAGSPGPRSARAPPSHTQSPCAPSNGGTAPGGLRPTGARSKPTG